MLKLLFTQLNINSESHSEVLNLHVLKEKNQHLKNKVPISPPKGEESVFLEQKCMLVDSGGGGEML